MKDLQSYVDSFSNCSGRIYESVIVERAKHSASKGGMYDAQSN